jgi:hypothetical protein
MSSQNVGSGAGGLTLVTGRDAGAVNGFVQVRHLDQLVLDVRRTVGAVVLGHLGGSTDEHISHPGFADVAAPVVGGEAFDQHPGEGGLAVHEDIPVGDEDVLQDHHRFLAGIAGVAGVQRAVLGAAGIA